LVAESDLTTPIVSTTDTRRPGFEAALRSEVQRIAASSAFRSSPLLTKLLSFLVEETLAGRGDALKSYWIAVQGLGRPSDFDARQDSYPRVQMARLRRALEGYYAQHGPGEDLCVYLPSGSYRVRLAKLAVAYPKYYRPLADARSETVASDYDLKGFLERGHGQAKAALQMVGVWTLVAVALALLLTAALAGLFEFGSDGRTTGGSASPAADWAILEIQPTVHDADPKSSSDAQFIYAKLVDGLSRSWITQVRTNAGSGRDASRRRSGVYTLWTQLTDARSLTPTLFVRVSDARTASVVWSQEVALDRDSLGLSDTMASLIADLSGPYGIIATQESRRLRTVDAPGYACLLQYVRLTSTRSFTLYPRVRSCLDRPSPEQGLEPTRLAFRAMLVLDGQSRSLDRRVAQREAMVLAQQAIEAGPKDAYAQFMMARLAFASSNCVLGERHTRMAVAANPYDPILLAVLGALSTYCQLPLGEDLLERAHRFRMEGDSVARLSLVLAAIYDKRMDRLTSLAGVPAPAERASLPYYHLCETLLAAARGDRSAAQANWHRYASALRKPSGTPDALLREYIVSDMMRSRIVDFLTGQGTFDTRLKQAPTHR
jgi:hypothetical protein